MRTYVLLPGLKGEKEQLDALEEMLNRIDPTASFHRLPHRNRTPYLTPTQAVATDANTLRAMLEADPDLQLWFIGLSMGGQKAVRIYEQLVEDFGSRVKVIAIDPPWDGKSIPGPGGLFVRLCGRLPSITRHWRFAAQCHDIATMMTGLNPASINHWDIVIITCKDNRKVIDSNRALDAWSGSVEHWLTYPIAGSHGDLSPNKPKKGVGSWEKVQADLRKALTSIIASME